MDCQNFGEDDNDFDPDMQLRWGEFFRDFVRDEAKGLGMTVEQLTDWKPPEVRRGRKSPNRR